MSATPSRSSAQQTFVLPRTGSFWREEPEFKVAGKNLRALFYQPFKSEKGRGGGNLNDKFGLDRRPWVPMRWMEERGAFDGSEGMPLWSGSSLSARENDLPVIVFIAPETGHYAFEIRSGTPTFLSHHRNIGLNVVHFPWGKDDGSSLGFFRTDATERKPLSLDVETDLAAGESPTPSYDVEIMKWVLDRMVVERGVDVWLHMRVVATQTSDLGRLTHVFLESKSGREAPAAGAFVDATGDGDLAALAGCGFDLGYPETGLTQSMSLMAICVAHDSQDM